jgi:Ser/Thr protein kinase RdoA (MazF antagonist)
MVFWVEIKRLEKKPGFSELTPDVIITAAEQATGKPFTGFASALPSYINRVYELQAKDGTRIIAKFYRPGRWTKEAIIDEHTFVLECHEAEIPVVAPMALKNGSTLAQTQGIFYALFPKRAGRPVETETVGMWQRLGGLIGRIHQVARKRTAAHRVVCLPGVSTVRYREDLLAGGLISPRQQKPFEDVTAAIFETIIPLFEICERIRIHGDCHRGNVLDRQAEGLMIIDFDDMMCGPPVQDLWLFLPDHASKCSRELNLMLEGYRQFCGFEFSSVKLIEPLRAMRMIYFIAWCSTQAGDTRFQHTFPDWGTEKFWQNEIRDLRNILDIIQEEGMIGM